MEEKILKALEALNGNFETLNKKVDDMAKDIKVLKTDVSDIKHKVNTINDQTADLTEFRTETRQKLEKIENGIEVLGKEDFRNKVELVEIKKKIAK